jgi:hypothetical protein
MPIRKGALCSYNRKALEPIKNFRIRGITERYIAAYESWREEQGRGVEESEFEALKSNLDGSYWSK